MADRVVVIGVGADGRLACPLPDKVTLVVGGRRHLETYAPAEVPTVAITGTPASAVEAVTAASSGTVAVLASGDPGWFGIVRLLAHAVGTGRLEVYPAASAVAWAFARIGGVPWEDAMVVSAHGRDPRAAVAAVLAHPKVAVLTAPDTPPARLAQALRAAGCGPRRVVVVARLGHADEEIYDTDLAGAVALRAADPNVVLFLAPPPAAPPPATVVGHAPARAPWGRPVTAYQHRDGQISKPAVRALALAHLGPAPGRLLWDVGCGSGSVAVEAAGLGAGVIALDRDPEQVARARTNAAAHRVHLGLVPGSAPGVLGGLPDPDAVFVGGGGSDLNPLLDIVAARCRDRVAVPLSTIERIAPALARLRHAGWHATAQLVQISDLVPFGAGHRYAPQNPVLLILGERR